MALKEFSGELDQPSQQKLTPFTGALDTELSAAPMRPEIKSIGGGLMDAAKQVGRVIFGDTPSMNDGQALHSLPPDPSAFDFAAASRQRAMLDTEAERRKTHGVIGPVAGPTASAGSIARGLVTDVATGAQRANAGVDQMLGDLTGMRPYLEAAKRGYAQANLTSAMHAPQFESETAAGIYGGLSSMARQAIPTAASIATRNPGIGLAGMTVPMVPEKYGEYRLRGETPVMSLLGAGSQAGVEYLTEKMPMTFLVNKMGRAGAGQFLTGLLAREVPGEQVATLVQDAIDTAVANPTMTWGEYVASRPSAAYQTLLATLTQGGIMGGVNSGMNRMAQQPAQPSAEDMLKQHGWKPAQPLAPVQQPAQQPPVPKMRRAHDNIKMDPVTPPQQGGIPTLGQLVQAFQPGATVADDMRQMRPQQPASVGQKPAGKAPDNVTRFAHSVRPVAERVAQQLRVPVEAVIGQWGLETGWGRSVIPGTNNLGNIKDFSGRGVAATDNMTKSRDRYRAYSSVDEFAGDFSNLIGNGRYRAVPGSKNAASYFGALKAAGYAEDPGYVSKGVSAARMAAAALGKPFDPGHAMQFDGQAQQNSEGRQGTDMQLYGAAQNQQGIEHRAALPDDPKAPDAGPMPIQHGSIDTGASDMFDAILQNRDRSTPGSIQQMQAIAANPDYGRMGYSRDVANGAPVVAGGTLPQEQLGRQDYAVASDGRRIPVQYAVVEAGQVHASNSVDGLPNQSYGDRNVAGLRAIAGNGRIAGVQSAYGAGRAGAYMQELIGDNMHGIDPGVVQRMRQPVLVRVMPQSAVTRDIGDVSNTVGNLSMSAVEQARNDARRLPMESLQFSPDGSMTPETVRQFVRGMPTSEQGAMLDNNGQPTRQAVDRAHAAVFAAAYSNDGLVRLYAQAQDPEARIIMSALAQAAPQMARLEGAGDLDIRELVTQAAEIAVNARRDGRTIQQAAQQLDLATDQGVLAVLDLFAANPRSSRPIAEALQRAAQFAYQEANKPAEDMFGAVPRATRQDVLAQLNEGGRDGTDTEGQTDLGQQAGREPDAGYAGRAAADAAGQGDAAGAEAGRIVAEPERDRFTGDLFGSDGATADFAGVPETRGGSDASGRAAGSPQDGQGGGAVQNGLSRNDVVGNYATRTELVQETTRTIGASRIDTPDAAARAMAYLHRYAVERFDALVTDAEGRPLAIVGSFKGDRAQTSVHPATIVGEAFRIDGAANIWLAHNHPSGKPDLSNADRGVSQMLARLLRGSQIKMQGIFAIGGKAPDGGRMYQFEPADAPGESINGSAIAAGSAQVPIVERVLTQDGKLGPAIRSPAEANAMARTISGGKPGVILLDNQNAPVAFVPVNPQEVEELRRDGRMDAMLRAFSMANAGSAIIFNDGSMSDAGANNLAQFFNAFDVRTLDIFKVDHRDGKAKSLAELGMVTGGTAFLSRGQDLPRTPVTEIRQALRKAYGGVAAGLERSGVVTLAQTETDAIEAAAQARADKRGTSVEAERAKLMRSMMASRAIDPDLDVKRSDNGAIQGFYDPATGKSFLIADNLTAEAAPAVLLHEVGIHLSNDGTLDPLFARAKQLVDGVKGNPFIDRVRERMESAGETSAEEAAAYMAEEYERDRLGAPNTVRQWIERFIADVRAWLHKHGMGVRADNLTPADIAAIARANLRRAANAPVQDDAGVKASRSESTKAAYEARIDALFAGQPASRAGVRVLDRADVLDLLGFGDMSVVLREGKVILGQDNHPRMTADVWKKVPQWLDSPAAVFDSDTVPGALVAIGPELVDGNPVRITLEPNRKQNTLDVHLLTNAYDAGGKTPWLRWSHEGLARYLDKKTFPAILAPSGLQLPRVEQIMRGTGKILTEKNLAGYRKQQGDAPSFSRAAPVQPGQQQAPLPNISQQQPPANNPPPAHQQRNMGQFGGGAPWTVDRDVEKDNLIRAMQNNKIDLKRVVDAVLATGKKIADNANPYLADELYIGRVTDGLEQLTERQIKPLLRAIADAGVDPQALEKYLHALHAEERNRQMAKVNNHPFDLGYNMSGMSTREARQAIQDVHAGAQAADMQRLATMVHAITRETRRRLVAEGLATVDEINAWEGAYKNYVPLMRDTEESGGRAQGYNVKGMESRRALGSQAEAKNILANVVAQAEASIIRAEKARVGRAMLQFAKDNPNPDFWTVNRAPTERHINKDTGLVETRAVPNFKNADTTLVVKVNGEEQYIVFNEKNERAVALVRNLKNMDVADLNAVTQGLGKVNRYIATWVTSRNPFFWITNFARDAQGVVINLQDTAIRGKELSVGAALPKAFGAVTMAEAGKPGNGLMARYYREFSEAGGKTGYIKGYRDSVERMGDITKEIARARQADYDPRKIGRALLDVIDSANDVVENGVRLAVYATARQNGVSIDQAASIAKNITVNFNRKGNHTGTLNSLYMFANAGIQGNMRMIQAIKSSRRAQVYAGGLMVAGMMMTALNILLGGDDEETRKKRYELAPEYERERSWILMIPGSSDDYVKVPLPIGPHILFNVGRVLVETAMLKDRKALDAAGSLVASTLASINPIGGGLPSKDLKGVAQTLTPSAVRPITDLAVNQGFAGTPIAKEAFGVSAYQKPAYQRTRDKTPGYWKGAAEMLNDWTGGDEVKPGAINTTPEALAYLVKAYTVPGIAQAADKTARAMTTEKGEITRLPGVDRFFGRIDEAARDRAAWDRSRSDAQVAGEIKQYLARGERDKATAALIELGGGDEAKGRRIAAMAEARDKQLREINAAKTKARKIENVEQRDAALQRLDARASKINANYMAAINR